MSNRTTRKVRPAPPPKPSFPEAVDMMAGAAILQLVRGEEWRSIVWNIAVATLAWKADQKDNGSEKGV